MVLCILPLSQGIIDQNAPQTQSNIGLSGDTSVSSENSNTDISEVNAATTKVAYTVKVAYKVKVKVKVWYKSKGKWKYKYVYKTVTKYKYVTKYKTVSSSSTSSSSKCAPSSITVTPDYVSAMAYCSCGAGTWSLKNGTFVNYCPACKKYGTLKYSKPCAEGQWTCSACDCDYCMQDGKEKVYSNPAHLVTTTMPTPNDTSVNSSVNSTV
jgi:hypothetical protein